MTTRSILSRWFFIIFSIGIIVLIFWNTLQFFNQLKEAERVRMKIWGDTQELLQQMDIENTDYLTLNTLSNIIQSNHTTPMILYTHKENIFTVNNLQESMKTDTVKLKKTISKFEKEYKPIQIVFEGDVLQTLYYGNSPIINKIKYYPSTLVVIITLFFLAIYFFYRTSKSSEQNKLWAGMAKETAHQIGTPLSSLVGWSEILKSENVPSEYIVEIEKDISRLQTITDRFSKIGSAPKLEVLDIVKTTQDSFEYLKSRTSKLIKFHLNVPNAPIYVKLNLQLYGWTIENLVKNGIDAMKGQGEILIEIVSYKSKVSICVSDTGKGISKKNYKKIFTPGFTTKKRGWGLGLSLAKRIIQEYHNGKIQVLKSVKNKGTTFEIVLSTLDKV